MDTEPQEKMDDVIERAEVDHAAEQQEVAEAEQQEPVEETRVPVSVVQKERKKRQEAEARAQRAEVEATFYREQTQRRQEPEVEDETKYESMTRGEYANERQKDRFETKRELAEEMWRESNPEKAREVDENLAEFLKQRPHLGAAINAVTNRYAEAYTLMRALAPRANEPPVKKEVKKAAPGNPSGVPKAAGVNQAVDLMSMTDAEYRAWRESKRARR